MIGDEHVEFISQLPFLFAYAQRDVEREPERALFLGSHRNNLERCFRVLCEIAGERSPRDGNVNITIRDSVHDPGRRIALAVIAVECETDDIVHHSARCQGVRGGRIDAVVADELHADFELAQLRIGE